jgi:hypothetical protein
LQEPRELVNGVLVEDELVAQAMRPRVDLTSGCLGEEVVKPSGGRHLTGMGVGGARAWLGATGDLGFERPDQPPVLDRAACEQTPPAAVGFGQERLAVALLEFAGLDEFDRFVG